MTLAERKSLGIVGGQCRDAAQSNLLIKFDRRLKHGSGATPLKLQDDVQSVDDTLHVLAAV
jgi:hypothetical protein